MVRSSDSDHASVLEPEIPHLRRYARSLTRDEDTADDLVQDCLVSALQAIGLRNPDGPLRAWLFVILRNKFRDQMRRGKREKSGAEDLEYEMALASNDSRSTQTAILEVKQAFARLSDEHREILFLVAVEGFEYEEAAEILNIPIGTIRSRLARARRKLKELIDSGTVSEERAQLAGEHRADR